MSKIEAVEITTEHDDCQRCGRTGLVRVVVLSDGSHVGTECMKRVLGWSITRRNADAFAGFERVAQAARYGTTYTLYRRGAQHMIAQGVQPIYYGDAARAAARFTDMTA